MSSKSSTPTSLLAVAASPGSGSGRNKVALKPGKSLMDWIRYTHSGKDLTSVGGKIQEVSAKELSCHNKKEDAWICLREKVYNITPYLEYHPGGEDELMRGAGKDATDLFNQIHRWVNAESMLQKCYVGRMNMSSLWLQKATTFPTPKLPAPVPKAAVIVEPVSQKSEIDGAVEIRMPDSEKQTPQFNWTQCTKFVNISIGSQRECIRLQDVIVNLVDQELFVLVHIKKHSYSLHVELEGAVSPTYDVSIKKSNCVELVFTKDNSEVHWEEVGKPLIHHDSFMETVDREIRYHSYKLMLKKSVTHNTYLFVFELPSGTKMVVPLGYHVHLKACIEGMEVMRSYTPVLQSLSIPSSDSSLDEGRLLHLMIKIYPDGALTPVIEKCEVGDTFFISDYIGNVSLPKLHECASIILIAAGTGFTPMVKLIYWALELEKDHNRPVLLLFFNRKEKDIPWKDELDNLCQKHTRFQVRHVLSEPGEQWSGMKGRISRQMLQDVIPKTFNQPNNMTYVCGPSVFTQVTQQHLSDLGYNKDSVHEFCG